MMPTFRQVLRAAACLGAVLLAAGCGGGGGGGGESTQPAVFGLTASPVGYSRTMTVQVSGASMLQRVRMVIDEGTCGPIVLNPASTNETTQFSCQVLSLGPMRLRILDTNGGELAQLSLNVGQPQVTISARQGTVTGSFVVDLDPAAAPLTVQNFLAYVNSGFYTSTLFHRVIAGFVVQGGGYTTGPTLKTPTRPAIVLESNKGLKNLRGTIAMARTNTPDSATSQFFVNLVDNPSLDYVDATNPGYAVFGRVSSGLDIVDAIATVPAGSIAGLANVPLTDVVITSVTQTR